MEMRGRFHKHSEQSSEVFKRSVDDFVAFRGLQAQSDSIDFTRFIVSYGALKTYSYAVSNMGLELPYKQGVGGSSPPPPTNEISGLEWIWPPGLEAL